MPYVPPPVAVSRLQDEQERRGRLQAESCPRGGDRHRFERQVRSHPSKPGRQQDAMICADCGVVLYPWKTLGGGKR